jgi:hypothetical protein
MPFASVSQSKTVKLLLVSATPNPDCLRLEGRSSKPYVRTVGSIDHTCTAQQLIENWYSIHSLIRSALKLGGLYWRGQRNAERAQMRHNYIRFQRLPRAFNGFTLLHISDLHVDVNEGAMRRLEELLPDLEYNICVITGDTPIALSHLIVTAERNFWSCVSKEPHLFEVGSPNPLSRRSASLT